MARIPKHAPQSVRLVAETMIANACKAWSDDEEFAARMVYVTKAGADGPWLVGPNAEGFGGSMVRYEGDTWAYRNSGTGEDTSMEGGLDEALSNARIYFTG